MRRLRTQLTNGYFVSYPTNGYWGVAEKLIPKILRKHKRDLHSRPVCASFLTNLLVRPGFGLHYYLTICVPGTNGVTATYNAHFCRKPGSIRDTIESFEKVAGSDIRTTLESVPNASEEALLLGQGFSNVRLRGFNFLLAQKRKANPHRSFAQLKKSTKAEWRKLPESEKGKLMFAALKGASSVVKGPSRDVKGASYDGITVSEEESLRQESGPSKWPGGSSVSSTGA